MHLQGILIPGPQSYKDGIFLLGLAPETSRSSSKCREMDVKQEDFCQKLGEKHMGIAFATKKNVRRPMTAISQMA